MSERREASRKRVYLGGRIVHRYGLSDTDCLLRNLSCGGARLVVSAMIPLPDRFTLVIESRGTTRDVETIWRQGDEIGVRFHRDASEPEGIRGPPVSPLVGI